MIRAGLLAVLAPVIGCSPRPATADPQTCAPSTAAPSPETASEALPGDYRIRLVATSGPRRDSSADGSLTLERAPSAAGTAHQQPTLFGAADVRLEDVGAPSADLASRDPMRPGVVGFDLPAPAGDDPSPRVLLRLGAEANRQDVVRVEGASTVLRVHEVRDDGFGGEWTANAPLPVAEGYFCAWRSIPDTSAAR